MDRLRLLDLRIPIAEVLNTCASSADIPVMVNRVERRLLRIKGGKWVGATSRMRICTASTGCLAWPRQIETIEGYQICGVPGTIRNSWYEFSGQGPGLLNADSSWYNTLVDRGTMPTFDTPSNNTSKVVVTAAVAEAMGARILIRGYDGAGQWIRTQEPAMSGTYIDGEYVAISHAATQFSVNVFSSISGVIKPVTKGPVQLFQYDVPTLSNIKALAFYEATEEVPIYRASLLPGLGARHGCPPQTSCNCPSTSTQVTVIAKLRHIDVVDDNDFLIIGNEAAFALGAQAILKERRNLWTEAQQYWASAEKELQCELSSFEGDGALPTLKTEGSSTYGAGVQNAISLGWPIAW